MRKSLRSTTGPTAEDLLSSAPSQYATKQGKSSLKTLISSLSPSSPLVSSLPSALQTLVFETLDSFTNGGSNRSSRSPTPKRSRLSKNDDEPSPETLIHLKKLQAFAFIAQLMISHSKKLFPPSEVFPAVKTLHDSLVLYENDPVLLTLVASICEQWWKEDLPGKDMLIAQSLPYFLSKSLSTGKKCDVQRVYSLREAFDLFDYEDVSIEDLRLLMVRCAIAPVYRKTDEGKKFVAFMVGLNDQLAKEVFALIKSQIPMGTKSVLVAYAEILFRAWKGSEGWLKEEIDEFLQGLIDGAVHARSIQLAASVRRVLGGFIEQKATDGVEKLLFRLSEPLIFRSLQVANSNVRQNALHLLFDLFPLEDPDATRADKVSLLEKQFFLVQKLLLDDCPDVRAVAVEGSCRVLKLFWEVIPSSIITKLLATIVDSMSCDGCSEVRLATVNGATYLLDNPQSHAIMKVLLPRLGCMIYDPSLSVRVALADLLLVVRDIRTFQLHKIVSSDVLFSSLENDHTRVAQKITKLLIPSYFPSKVSLKEACGRCIALIKRSPTAGARFCEFALSECSSSESLVELLKIMVIMSLSPKDLNPDQVDGLYVASANICRSLSCEPSNKAALDEIFPTKRLKCLFTAASSLRSQIAVLTIASAVASDELTGFRDNCLVSITSSIGLADNVESQTLVQAAHKLMLSYGWVDELFGVLTSVLQSIACCFLSKFDLQVSQADVQLLKKIKVKMPMETSATLEKVCGKIKASSTMSKAWGDISVAASAAWQLKDLLTDVNARNTFLKSSNCEIVFASLRIISQVSIEQCVRWDLLDVSSIMAYTGLAFYLSVQSLDAASGCKSSATECSSSPPELTILDGPLCHLLNCAEKLFCQTVIAEPTNSCSRTRKQKGTAQKRKFRRIEGPLSPEVVSEGDLKNTLPETKMKRNVIKVATSICQFVTDAITIGVDTNSHIRCLKFASSYVQYIISSIKGGRFKEDDHKDVLVFLKSSITYVTKLLHLAVITPESSVPAREVFCLTNDILDLIASLESDIGSKYALHVFTVLKPWLPSLILGLGSTQLSKATQAEEDTSSSTGAFLQNHFPLWLTVIGKSEIYKCSEINAEQENKNSSFKKFMETVVILLKKGNSKVLDAIGSVLLSGVQVGLEKEDFGLALSLLHFTCVKLLGEQYNSWKELEYMPSSLKEIHVWLQKQQEDTNLCDDGKHFLESASELLQSFPVDLNE